jgi:tRNA threonylcarbamoyladenosine biosynthesis protein TsaB
MADSKRILAIESSGRHCSVATLCGDANGARLVGQTLLTGDERTAQVLAPTIQQLLEAAGWQPKDVELVAVTVGPGSFTGLRIGVTTAKAFAYAIGAEVVGVNTLTALAQQVPASGWPLWAVLDAQRQELFAAEFVVGEGQTIYTKRETCIVGQDTWLNELQPGDRVVGLALERLASRLPDYVEVLPEPLWQPTAQAVGQVAWKEYLDGRRDDVWKLAPNYYRPSAAEEKRMQQ